MDTTASAYICWVFTAHKQKSNFLIKVQVESSYQQETQLKENCWEVQREIKYYNNDNHLLSSAKPCGGNKANSIVISLHSMLSSVAWIISLKKTNM